MHSIITNFRRHVCFLKIAIPKEQQLKMLNVSNDEPSW